MLRTPPLLETPRFAPQFEAEESELWEGAQSSFRGAQPPSRLRSQCPLLPGCGGAAADKVPFQLGGSGEDPPRARHRHLPLGDPWSGLGTWILLCSFCSQCLSPTGLHLLTRVGYLDHEWDS